MEEVITKNLEVKDNLKPRFQNEVDIVKSTFLSRPIALRLWSSFFVILPIFVQAPWVRSAPISALCSTFFILAAAFLLSRKEGDKWFIVGSLLLGVSGSWLGGCLFWGWLSAYPILHIPVEAVAVSYTHLTLPTNREV